MLEEKYPLALSAKGIVSPGWVDSQRFRPVAEKISVRDQLAGPWKTSLPIFFTLRRLEPRMGLDRLIDAVHCLREAAGQISFRLIIGGAGSQRTELENQIQRLQLQEHVHLIGRVSDEVVPRCFAAADCFVLPTTALECFGLIVLEAYASGTPVIATPIGAIPELICDESPGWLTAGIAPADLAAKMREFLEGRLPFSSNRLREHAESFSIERSAFQISRTLNTPIQEPV
jgi:glycosyltransferase involved in cell wall biosynthesis